MTKIHILGASGSGTTTLGEALSEHLNIRHFDTDDYYWKIKYTEKVEVNERARNLLADISVYDSWILTGSLVNWSQTIEPHFDLVIFLAIPQQLRLERLLKREYERYGKEIEPGGSQFKASQDFLDWASLYDHGGVEVRSRELHDQWMKNLNCPLLTIDGDYTVRERVDKVVEYLKCNKL